MRGRCSVVSTGRGGGVVLAQARRGGGVAGGGKGAGGGTDTGAVEEVFVKIQIVTIAEQNQLIPE